MLRAMFIGLLSFMTYCILANHCGAQVLEQVIIFKKPGIYACFPDLFKASDGTLVATFGTRTTKSHHNNAGGAKTLISQDQGRTWKAAEKEYINPVYKRKDGRIVIPAVNGWKSVTPEEASRLKNEGVRVDNINGRSFYAVGAFLKISQDDGKSWHRQELDLLIMPFLCATMFRACSRPEQGFCSTPSMADSHRPKRIRYFSSGRMMTGRPGALLLWQPPLRRETNIWALMKPPWLRLVMGRSWRCCVPTPVAATIFSVLFPSTGGVPGAYPSRPRCGVTRPIFCPTKVN